MKIPKQVKIGGHTYKVLYPYQFKERSDVFGTCNSARNEIRLTNLDGNGFKLPMDVIEQNFIHELLHAISIVYYNDNLEEKTVEVLSQGLYQVLSDNKMLK